MSPTRSPTPLWPLALVFAISGAGALVVETIWMRWFREWTGATAPATAATTSAIFAGASLGAWLGGRRAERTRSRNDALRVYARVEILAAGGALAMPFLLEGASRALALVYAGVADDRVSLAALRFAAALLVTLPAGAAYGATLPLIGAAALASKREMGTRGTGLYATGIVGSVLGVAVAAWWAPPRIGVHGTYAVGLAFSLAAAAAAGMLARFGGEASRVPASARSADARPRAETVLLSALSGFVSLGAQVLLVQAFGRVVDQSVIAFAAVLIAVLGCLAVGAYAVAALRRLRLATSRSLVGWALVVSALGFALVPAILHATTDGLQTIAAGALPLPYGLAVAASVLVAAGPALLAAACIWPATLALAGDEGDVDGDTSASEGGAAGARLGVLSAANTAGALAAGIVTPFVVLPLLGPWSGFLAVAVACALAAVLVAPAPGRRRWVRPAAVVLGGAVVLLAANPLSLPLSRRVPGARLLFERNSAAGIVSVLERGAERLVRLDDHYVLGGTSERVHEERQGHLPLVLHGAPKRVAFVGTATGITAGAALAHDVDEVTLIEIVPDVAEAGARYFAEANRGVYADPRSRVVVDDARNYWRHTDDEFDVIVADLFVPWHAGTGVLYTREHFAAMRDRLRPGGLVAQWLPLYQLSNDEVAVLLATFADVFPKAALFRGDFYGSYPIVALIGWRDGPASSADVEAAARRLAERGVDDRWVTRPDALWSLYVSPSTAAQADGAPMNLLAWPRIEYMAASRHGGGARGAIEPLVGLAWVRRAEEWQRSAPQPDPLYPSLSSSARNAQRGGTALQRAGALHAAGRVEEASRALARAAELLPYSVVAGAPPDASAADVWVDER